MQRCSYLAAVEENWRNSREKTPQPLHKLGPKKFPNVMFLFDFIKTNYKQIFVVQSALPVSLTFRSNHPEVFLVKDVLKICSRLTGEHLCWSVISIKFQSNFIEIALRYECFPVNLLHIFRTLFTRSPLGGCFRILKFNHGYFVVTLLK